jgi:outer membrane lipoprotein SlyB
MLSTFMNIFMKTATFLPILALALGALTACSNAAGPTPRIATVTMTDGTWVSGTITESSAIEVKLTATDGKAYAVPMILVRSIRYDDAAPETPKDSSTTRPVSAPVAAKPVRIHEDHYHPTPAAISTKTYVVPVDAELSVRTEDTIDSETAAEGQTYAAEITKDVLDADGKIVIPDGSNGQIVIKSASQGSRFHGASDLILDLQSVSVGGVRYQISAVDIEKKGREGVGANKRTAIFTGAGAAIGAVIGAISGGGKGAAIGAASGAGAGAIAQVITSGNSIRVPAETILTFRLDKSLKVTAK